jgi:hypothetical protein
MTSFSPSCNQAEQAGRPAGAERGYLLGRLGLSAASGNAVTAGHRRDEGIRRRFRCRLKFLRSGSRVPARCSEQQVQTSSERPVVLACPA